MKLGVESEGSNCWAVYEKGLGFFPFFLDDNILFVNGLFIRAMCSLKGL